MITVSNLRKVYKMGKEKVVALNNINIEIKKGEICCILGTSGSGKSTLLNMLAGLEKPTRGDIIINKSRVNKLSEKKLAVFRQKYIGFVFQSYNLIPTLTAEENVALPLVFRRFRRRARLKSSKEMLRLVGLGDRLKHKPTQMSGGQQQRVGIARAFVARPAVVFADEPTGNLDSKTTIEVIELMLKIARDNNQTLVIVTHNSEIAEYADRIIQLKDGLVTADYAPPEKKY
ncbi:MAG: ABC transporter ATP-binding protein [Oscillospiraceae bacterium]|nr:ABC transporter ATP-binding protein [Oscillospiraceae bacterium]